MIKIENVITPSAEQWMATIMGARNAMNSWDKSDSGISNAVLKSRELTPGVEETYYEPCVPYISIGKNDITLMKKLINAGPDHRKFMRYFDVIVNITAPLYWWKEFKTYRHGRKFMDDEDFFDYDDDEILEMHIETNSCSTMHKIHEKEFARDDFSIEHLADCELVGLDGYPDGMTPRMLMDMTIDMLNYYRKCFIEDGKNKDDWWQLIQLLPSSYNQMRTVKLNYEVLARMYKSRKAHKLDEWREFCKWIEQLPYVELITGGKDDDNKTDK